MRVLIALALALSLSHLPSPARAVELELELGLFNRYTLVRQDVERLLRFSPGQGAFDVRSYLAPSVDRDHFSVMAAAGATLKLTGWLSVGVLVDSGELRPLDRVPGVSTVQLVRLKNISTLLGDPQVVSTEDERMVTSNGQPIADEALETLFIREVYLRFTTPETGWLSARAGRFGAEVAGSLIYNDFGLGLDVLADLERLKDWPVRAELKVLLPTRTWQSGLRSPLVELRVDYVFSAFLSLVESIGVTLSYFHDNDDNFGQLFQPTLAEVAVTTQPSMNPQLHREITAVAMALGMPSRRADIAWIGVDGNKLFGDLRVAGTFLLEIGHLSLDNPYAGQTLVAALPRSATIELDTLGYAAQLTLHYLFTEAMALGGFFLYLSGAENPLLDRGAYADGRYPGFLSVVPYLTHTNLFFSGGMNETFSGRQARTAGINGRGVIAFGSTFTWDVVEDGKVLSTAAGLFSPVPSITGGNFYGVEVDLEGSYRLFEILKISLEYDFMWAGSFFPRQRGIHKFLVGVDLTYEL